jgi:1-deoxy-D-xylulose 5-phosphate reductoisomerase
VLTCANQVPLLLEQKCKQFARGGGGTDLRNKQKMFKAFPGIDGVMGQQGLSGVASSSWDMISQWIVGISGLAPTYYGIQAGNTIALANKKL